MSSIYAQKPWLKHYLVPAELPLPRISTIDAFEASVHRAPDSPAIHYFDETISFGQLNDRAERFAALLSHWGIGKGDRIAIATQNDPQFAIAQLGAWKRGAIVVPLNPMFKEKEIEYHLKDSGASVWLGLDSLRESARPAIERCGIRHAITTTELALLLEAQRWDPAMRVAVGPDDIALLVYTSGTTGVPKGAMNLHGNIVFNAEVFRAWMQIGRQDSIFGLAPLFHITGLVAELALSYVAGVPLVLFHRFDAAEALRMIRKWRPTMCVAAITAYLALMNHKEEVSDAGPFLPKCYSGGAPVAPSITDRFQARFGTYIHNIYGLTESTSPSHAVPMGGRAPVDPKSGALSIGVPIPNCEARILDLEDPTREVATGEAGELALRGPMMFSGYWNKSEATASAFEDGFFRTGDVAVMDADGWFYLVDRKKDMIIASGFKVWPREVEDMLYQHPAVREAAVIGVPDAYRGETVKAFVALREDAGPVEPAEIVAFCRERMAAYKYPREVEFVPEIPKTASGKFLRRELRGRNMGV